MMKMKSNEIMKFYYNKREVELNHPIVILLFSQLLNDLKKILFSNIEWKGQLTLNTTTLFLLETF